MIQKFVWVLPAFMIVTFASTGCNQTQNPSSGEPVQSARPAPPQQRLTLYMVPLDQSKFSMASIQQNKSKIQTEPKNVTALMELGHANFMIQRFDVSAGYYERVLKIEPRNIEARISLSNTYIFMQNLDGSLGELDKILAVDKNHAEALYNKGLIMLQSKGDSAGSKVYWDQLIKKHPDHQLTYDVKQSLAKTRM